MTDKYLNRTQLIYSTDPGVMPIPAPAQVNQASPSKPLDAGYDPFKVQVGGSHYSRFKIQPLQYIEENNIPFADGCIIKYVTRWRFKNGVEDLRKAKHFIEMLIALEEKKNEQV